jgi:hypothetical protein
MREEIDEYLLRPLKASAPGSEQVK